MSTLSNCLISVNWQENLNSVINNPISHDWLNNYQLGTMKLVATHFKFSAPFQWWENIEMNLIKVP